MRDSYSKQIEQEQNRVRTIIRYPVPFIEHIRPNNRTRIRIWELDGLEANMARELVLAGVEFHTEALPGNERAFWGLYPGQDPDMKRIEICHAPYKELDTVRVLVRDMYRIWKEQKGEH